MATPLNPSFEAGALGVATDWTDAISFHGYAVADFGEPGGLPTPIERFASSSWGTAPYDYVVSGGTAAVFDALAAPSPSSFEAFGRWFGNGFYQYVIDGGIGFFLESDNATSEDFVSSSWGTQPYLSVLIPGVGFTFAAPEDFTSTTWNGGAAYLATVTGTAATFNNGTRTAEEFSPVAADLIFIPDPGADTCDTLTPHGKSNGYIVTVASTGLLAGGLVANRVYYFVSVTSTTFKLSTTLGGSPVTITDVGSGTHTAHADESAFWTETG